RVVTRSRDKPVSAAQRPTVAAVTGATLTADTITSVVGLVAEQVDVEDVQADPAAAHAALATRTTVAAATGIAIGAEQRHHSPGWQQLRVLAVDLNKAQCVRHQSS